MHHKKISQRGVTLIELLVSAVILALTLMSLANIYVGGRRWLLHARSRMTGGELGKVFLEPLQMQVRQAESSPGAADGWDQLNNGLSVTPPGGRFCGGNLPAQPNCPGVVEATLHGIPYNIRYDINPVAGTDLRRVRITIRWTEHQP